MAPPAEGAHETFTLPPGGTLLDGGAKTPGCPFRVQLVASTDVPPALTSVMMHVPWLALQFTTPVVTCAVVAVILYVVDWVLWV
jgi:hypothetical protein